MIRFDHVSKSYKGTPRPALDDLTTEILRGEFVFVVGASGSGKSTFLRLILREEKATRGRLHVLGQDLSTISNRKVPYFRRNVGVVFQDFRLLTNKTVFDNVAFTLKVIGKSNGFIHEAVPDVLTMVGLEDKAQRFPHELSGGEQQRVAIARAVVNKPQVLLADEPTGNLDPTTSAGIISVLERINAGGTTVLVATHEAAIVDRLQKRVIELSDGRLVRDEREGGYGTTPVEELPGAVAVTTGAVAVAVPVATAAAGTSVRADRKAAKAAAKAAQEAEKAAAKAAQEAAKAEQKAARKQKKPATATVVPEPAAVEVPTPPADAPDTAQPAEARSVASVMPIAATPEPAAEQASAAPIPAADPVEAAAPQTPAVQPRNASAPTEPAAAPADSVALAVADVAEQGIEASDPQPATTTAEADDDELPSALAELWDDDEDVDDVSGDVPLPEPVGAATHVSSPETAGTSGVDAHFSSPPVRPGAPGGGQEVAELSLAERLGLRAASGPEDDSEQDVGPVK
jgi:cell division transport system ATP-binding protein